MSIKVEKTDKTNELKLTFTVEAEKFDEGMKTVYKKTAKYFSIPGFRKGKAPMSIIERTYGSSIFYEDTFNEIVPEIYEKELKRKQHRSCKQTRNRNNSNGKRKRLNIYSSCSNKTRS